MFELEEMVARGMMTNQEMLEHRERVQALGLPKFTIRKSVNRYQGIYFEARGEQPESPIHSDHGALRGDIPLSITERSEV